MCLLLLSNSSCHIFFFIVISSVVSDILAGDSAFKGHEQLREIKCKIEYDADTIVNFITLQKLGPAASAPDHLKEC